MKKKTQAFRISVFGVKRQNERQVAQCVICEATDSSLFFVTKFARNFFFDSAEILRAGPIMNAYRVFQLSRFFTCCFPRGFLALLILRVRILRLPLFWCRQFLSIYSIGGEEGVPLVETSGLLAQKRAANQPRSAATRRESLRRNEN